MQPTDPIALLEKDHRDIKHLFKEFESADGRSYRRISNEVFDMLEAHNEVEESIFYPMIRAVLPDEFIVEEGLEEHHVIRMLIDELKAMDEVDIHFEAKFKVLSENCEHHFEEEEEKMFPKAAKLEDALRASIAETMQIKKEELLAAASA